MIIPSHFTLNIHLQRLKYFFLLFLFRFFFFFRGERYIGKFFSQVYYRERGYIRGTPVREILEIKNVQNFPGRIITLKGLNVRYYTRHLLISLSMSERRICIWESELLPEIFSSLALDENERGVATATEG